jgi:cold shock CspA family protein
MYKKLSFRKKYGFITGADGKKYFFHLMDVLNIQNGGEIIDGLEVQFEPGLSEKGYRASRIFILDPKEMDSYTTPSEVVTSKSNGIRGWEIVRTCDWLVVAEDKGDPDVVREKIKSLCSSLGGNGVVNLTYEKKKGSEGNYQFTIHSISGRPVFVAKRSVDGDVSINEFPDLDAACQAAENERIINNNKKRKRLKSVKFKVGIGILSVAAMLPFIFGKLAIGFSIFFVVIALLIIRTLPPEPSPWLKRVDSQ